MTAQTFYSKPVGPVTAQENPAAEAQAYLEATTVSYPQWQAYMKAGKYTPRDGSGTNWGKALMILAALAKQG